MRKTISSLLIWILSLSLVYADVATKNVIIRDEDSSPSGVLRILNVTNGTLTDNGSGNWSLDTGGGGGSLSLSSTNPMGILYISSSNTIASSPLNVIDANNNVGIATTAPMGLLQIGTSPASIMTVLSTGFVGIGTTNPTAPISVVGDGMTFSNPDSAGSVELAFDSDTAAAALLVNGSALSPTDLYTYPNLTAISGEGDAGLSLIASNVAGTINFATGGSAYANQRMRIDATGNIGIGTTAPWQELTVSGDVTISDDTPNLTFRDSDSNVAWQWHLDTAADGYALWKGTDSGTGFSVTPDTPIIKIDSNNQVKMSSQLHILQGTLDLASLYDIDPDVWVLDLHSDAFPNGIYITKIYVDCSVADPTTEIDADLKYCDAVADGAFPGANAVVVTAIDTTTGNFANASLNTAIPTGKTLYITLNADPTDATTVYHIRIHYRIL